MKLVWQDILSLGGLIPSPILNDSPASNNGPSGDAPAPHQPPVEATGRGLLTLENAGPLQMGFWVPNRVYATIEFLAPLRKEVAKMQDSNQMTSLHPAVADFKNWVTSHSVYRMWVHLMIEQGNAYLATQADSCAADINEDGDALWIAHYGEFFNILSAIIQTSPQFNTTVNVGCPMAGFLAVGLRTRAGVALFHDTTFNSQLQKVLDAWNEYLKSPQSLYKLDINEPEKPGSWISKEAFDAGVWQDIQFDPTKDAYGFSSWNDFFIRQFVPGARPFDDGDATEVVNIGCETTPWACVPRVEKESNFWIKDKKYSLMDLFGGKDDVASLFVGGTVYQGYLLAVNYHRWHSPVDGQLVRSWVEPGTYFAQRPFQDEDTGGDGWEFQNYQGHVATRAIFVFKHPKCGYVAMICVGMGEVSTCHIDKSWRVNSGDDPKAVSRGTEIGHFEFGGSTQMLLFQKDKVTIADWARRPAPSDPVRMGTVIATALDSA
ncbi:hypothetical protein KJ359_007241 [Pestalotiopsis sp. 9143b]|nr:hypothetical protein KJ359_007241 [Pestalotiopsis sp. 9143b]